MNSVIEAQIELAEQQELEWQRCLDPTYWYLNYWRGVSERELHTFRRATDPNYGVKIINYKRSIPK